MCWYFNVSYNLSYNVSRVQCLSLLILAVLLKEKFKNVCGFGRYASRKALPFNMNDVPRSSLNTNGPLIAL